MKAWLVKTVDGKYRIQRITCPSSGQRVAAGRPPCAVLHTTEGSYDSALSVFRKKFAPQFLVGQGKIAQLIPIGTMATTLQNAPGGPETNRWALIQIEVAGFSRDTPYLFDPQTTDALASLMATLKVECEIPLIRPYGDAMPPKPWATTSFVRRRDGKYGKTAGWFGHVEIPENSHWDPGWLKWADLLHMAQLRLPGSVPQAWYVGLPGPSPKPGWAWDMLEEADRRRIKLGLISPGKAD